jgi:hypothetical protein
MGASADGKMKELRAGTNGRMACSISPATRCASTRSGRPGATLGIKKEPPTPTTVGVAYMLKGDKGASNTDPYATKPTADNEWVVSGPHIMILPTDVSQLDAYPTIGRPWVMWKGTPYRALPPPSRAPCQEVRHPPLILRLALATDPRRAQRVLGSDGHLFDKQSRGGQRLHLAIQPKGGKPHRRVKPE